MKKKNVTLILVLFGLQVVCGQIISNNAFSLSNTYGDLKMRRYSAGDTNWKRALVPEINELILNYGGDFSLGLRIHGAGLRVDNKLRMSAASAIDNQSPGLAYKTSSDFLYDNQYINNYGFGFHGYQDGSTSNTEPLNSYMSGYWGIDFFTSGLNRFRISADGLVSIGSPNRQPGYLLAVNGKIKSKEIKVETSWSDFVFYKDYPLPSLEEVELFIKKNGHLKDIPSEKEVSQNGILVGEMNAKLLQKIEELMLYTIDQEKRMQKLERDNLELRKLLNLSK